jgi:hypothetical protein
LTLHDAAVRLRLLGAHIERGQPARLLTGALEVVERAAVELPALSGSNPLKVDRFVVLVN